MILFTPDPELIALAEAENADFSEWQTLADDVRHTAADTSVELSDNFNATLKTALLSEVAPSTPPSRAGVIRRVWPAHFPRPLATAAAVVALISIGIYLGRDSTIAWGDVVRAAKKIDQCHMMVFIDSPRAADPERRNHRVDWYYRQPDQWRVHNPSGVLFFNGKDVKFWDLEKRNFAYTFKGNVKIYGGISTGIQNGDLLTAMLSGMFQGKPPTGEPVKSDDVSAANGIDVFDFGKNSGDQWARIWVVRDSRLPIRAHVYQPQSDGFQLVDFDYSDPQPAEFFDPAAFEKVAKDLQSRTPQQTFLIGQRPVGTRPRGTSQIHETAGGYRAPEIKRLAANADGDVMILTDEFRNVTPRGDSPFEEGYGHPTDNWGNRYFLSGLRGSKNERRTWFSPVQPFKQGQGQRQVTLNYSIQPDYNGDPLVLRTDTLEVPPPTGSRGDFPAEFAKDKTGFYRNYLTEHGTLAEQLAEIDRVLAADANHLPTLAWKFRLYRQHNRDADAWTLFEAALRDRVAASVEVLDDNSFEAAQYLLYLHSTDRQPEARAWAARLQNLVDEAERRTGAKRASVQQLVRKQYNPLRTALAAQGWREQFKDAPTVTQVVSPEAGFVAVEMQVPAPPAEWQSTGSAGGQPLGWFFSPQAIGWNQTARSYDPSTGTLWTVYRGSAPVLKLEGEVMLAADNVNTGTTRHDLKLRYSRDINIPQPLGQQAAAWWAKLTNGHPAAAWYAAPAPIARPALPPAGVLLEQAEKTPTDEAIALLDRALALPKEQWPDYLSHPANGADAFERELDRVRVVKADRLAQAGRYGQARAIAAELLAAVPTPVDYNVEPQSFAMSQALAAHLTVPRAMLAAGDFKSALRELDHLAPLRPNVADLPPGTKMIDQGGGVKIGFNPRHRCQEMWRTVDELWWKARDGIK